MLRSCEFGASSVEASTVLLEAVIDVLGSLAFFASAMLCMPCVFGVA